MPQEEPFEIRLVKEDDFFEILTDIIHRAYAQ